MTKRDFWVSVGIVILAAVMAGAIRVSAGAVDDADKPASEETTMHYIEPDWAEVMIAAASSGDALSGEAAQAHTGVSYDDVVLLAKIMEMEDGIDWPEPMIMLIGEVVLNRAASPLFPDSIYDVLHAPGQYAPVGTAAWDKLAPWPLYTRLAYRLLTGERVLGDEGIVFQALFPQGGQTVLTYYDAALGSTTYFCR